MNELPKPSFLRRLERWLVGLVMMVMAFGLEQAVLRSIRRGGAKDRSIATPPA